MSESKALCIVCRHLATDHAQEGLAPCRKWTGPQGVIEYEPHVGPPNHRCPCPNFVLDYNSLPDELTHSELDKKCFEFFEATNMIAEQLQRIGDLIEGGIDVGVRKE